MALKIYTYRNCGTCKKALKFLHRHGIEYVEHPIREKPPSKSELKKMLRYKDGNIRKLFNTSSGDYKSMGMKNRIDGLTESDVLDLLHEHGNLIKRPFVLGKGTGTVGFNEEEWRELFVD